MESSAEATLAGELSPPSVPQEMFNVHVLPTLENHSILSFGKIYVMQAMRYYLQKAKL